MINWDLFSERVNAGCKCRYLSDYGIMKNGILQETRPYRELDSAASISAERELLPWTMADAIAPGDFLSIQIFEERWESGNDVTQMPVTLLEFFIDGHWMPFEKVINDAP